ncbi:hypothetical protein MCOR25_005073 [Pyricularia grisea]|nr:hypothetical protein MCOR25_005073 [Pyricularia grisea]
MLPTVLLLSTILTSTITAGFPNLLDELFYIRIDDFKDAMLTTHNRFRSEYSAFDRKWNDTLAESSTFYLDEVAISLDCEFEHPDGPYGRNLFLGYSNASVGVIAWVTKGESTISAGGGV